ncbi:MAG: GGDEF domain-containing protein [Thermaerobacter sp.]|nr:GGDEF domain-containing protein [Thermaerobacter sp.]
MKGSPRLAHREFSVERRQAPSLWWVARPLAVGYVVLAALIGAWGAWSVPQAPWLIFARTLVLEIVLLALVLWVAHHLVVTRLLNPLRHRARVDELTGLLRAGEFWEQAEIELDAAYRARKLVSFVFLDLDDFKQVNDTVGHLAGDAVLRQMGRLLREHVRAEDVVGRLGGEEFGWLLPGAAPDAARHGAERLLDVCRAAEVAGVHGFTFSAGVAVVTGTEPTPLSAWDLAREADRAQYEAKGTGKGKVTSATQR